MGIIEEITKEIIGMIEEEKIIITEIIIIPEIGL